MSLTTPTVQVYSKEHGGDEFVTINASDFDERVHRLVGDGPWSLEKADELKGKLPEDFPGRRELEAFDPPVHTYAQLRKLIKQDIKVPGIGDVTRAQIQARLGDAFMAADDE